MKRAALAVIAMVVAVSFAASCSDQREPIPPRLSADISDAGNSAPGFASNPHFFWLPPLVTAPSPTGVFNPRLSPVVQICSEPLTPCPTERVHATFTTTGGSGGQTVRVDLTGQQYIVNWKTSATSEPAGSSFRVAVIVHNQTLGFADVDIVGTGKAKNAHTGDDIALVDGSTLPLKFRIEDGALAASCADPSQPRDCAEQQAFPDRDNTIVTSDEQAGTFIPEGALSQPVTVTIIQNTNTPCIPGPFALPQFPGCYDFFTDPGPTQFNTDVIVGLCVETDGLGSIVPQLQIFQFDPGLPVRALTNVPATFLPCNGGVIGSRGSAATGLLASARARVRSVWRALAPRPLVAAHVGVGGSAGAYSTFTWSFVSEMVLSSLDPQTAIVGTTVESAPTVLLRDTTAAHNPVAGVTVAFTADGGGTIKNSSAVTGSGGLASAGSWTVPATPGTYHVTATAGGAMGSPVTFTATAVIAAPDLVVSSGALTATPSEVLPGGTVTLSPWTITNQGNGDLASPTGSIRNGFYLSADTIFTSGDVLLDDNFNTNGVLQAGQSFDWGGPTLTIPANTAPGTYYLAILVDDLNRAAETNERNNFVSVAITVLAPLR